jgi:hypothetical protein
LFGRDARGGLAQMDKNKRGFSLEGVSTKLPLEWILNKEELRLLDKTSFKIAVGCFIILFSTCLDVRLKL